MFNMLHAHISSAARSRGALCSAHTMTRSTAASRGSQLYEQFLRDHQDNPRNVGALDKKMVGVGTALVGKASRGGVIKLQVRVEDGMIKDAKFKAIGRRTDFTIASMSYATERIKGIPVGEAMRLTDASISSQLKVPLAEAPCFSLATAAIHAAVADYGVKHQDAIDHICDPRNIGSLDASASDVGTAVVGKASRGGVVKMQVHVQDGIIKDAKFKAIGCSSTISSCSYATERIKGTPLDKVVWSTELKLPGAEAHSSALVEEAIRGAIADYMTKQDIVGDRHANFNDDLAVSGDADAARGGEASREGLAELQVPPPGSAGKEHSFIGADCPSSQFAWWAQGAQRAAMTQMASQAKQAQRAMAI